MSVGGKATTGGLSPTVNPFRLVVVVSEPVCFYKGDWTISGVYESNLTPVGSKAGCEEASPTGTKVSSGWSYEWDVTPTIAVGESTVTIRIDTDGVEDAAGNTPSAASRTVTFSADIAAVLALLKPADKIFVKDEAVPTTGNSASARNGELRMATGGTPPYTYVLEGTVPTGLSLDTTGTVPKLTGTPTAAGTTTVTLKVTDSATPTAGTVTQSFT